MIRENRLGSLRVLGRNFTFSLATFGLRVGANFFLLVLAARVLSVDSFGQYMLAISLGSLLVVFVDYGFNFYLTRSVANDRETAGYVLSNGLAAKACLSVLALGALSVVTDILQMRGQARATAFVVLISFLSLSYGTFLTAALKGIQRFELETRSSLVLYVVIVTAQAIAFLFSPDPLTLACGFLLGRLVFAGVCSAQLRSAMSLQLPRPSAQAVISLTRKATPLALYAGSAVATLQLSTIILAYFGSDADVGEFQMAFRLAVGATIPMAVSEDVFYAFLAREWSQRQRHFTKQVKLINRLGGTILVPLVAACLSYPHLWVRVAYGAGASDRVALIFSIVVVAYLLLYLLFVSPVLMARGADRVNLSLWIGAATVNTALSLLMIPRWAGVGAAWAMLGSYAAIKVGFLIYCSVRGWWCADRLLFTHVLMPHAILFALLVIFRPHPVIGLSAIVLLTIALSRPYLDVLSEVWGARRGAA